MYSRQTFIKKSYLTEVLRDKVPLGDVLRVTSGFFCANTKLVQLLNCNEKDGGTSCFSKMLEEELIIDNEFIFRLLDFNDVDAYASINPEHSYPKGIIPLSMCEMPTQPRGGERWYDYIRRCAASKVDYALPQKILSQKQWEAVIKPKIVVRFDYNKVQAALDEKGRCAYSMGMYAISPMSDDSVYTLRAYMAILNSKIFAYLFYTNWVAEARGGRPRRYDVLKNIPLPSLAIFEKEKNLLSAIVEGLMWLKSVISNDFVSLPNSADRMMDYLEEMLNMVIYEMYLPEHMSSRGLSVINAVRESPIMESMYSLEDRVVLTYKWLLRSENIVRQSIMLLDTRSPEFIYKIHQF